MNYRFIFMKPSGEALAQIAILLAKGVIKGPTNVIRQRRLHGMSNNFPVVTWLAKSQCRP